MPKEDVLMAKWNLEPGPPDHVTVGVNQKFHPFQMMKALPVATRTQGPAIKKNVLT